MPEIKHMNEFLLSYCATHDVIFIDVFAPLLKNDCLDSALTKDGLHLNNKGYAIWRDEIQKYLRPED
jgi:lysophospholipase L1-like esterase